MELLNHDSLGARNVELPVMKSNVYYPVRHLKSQSIVSSEERNFLIQFYGNFE